MSDSAFNSIIIGNVNRFTKERFAELSSHINQVQNQINTVHDQKESLGKDKTLPKSELAEEENLLKWLDGHSMIQIFDWFDCVERTDVGNRHWTTETTRRDQLFLKKLGVTKSCGY